MSILRLSSVDVDLETGAIGDKTRLATTELALLSWFAQHPGEEVSRDRLLREVWRFPGQLPETRAVDLAMARLRRKVERDPAHPEHLITVQGTGYRFVPYLSPEASLLPRPANRFVGRIAERARIGLLLDGGARLVTLVGPGGVGKTRLALEVAVDRPNATFCDASEARERGALSSAAHQALAARAHTRHATIEPLLADLGNVLLVLDNVEQVLDSAAELISDWLQRAPGLVLLVTSREPLGLIDEHLVDVAPLLGPRADDAVALLLERSRQLDVLLDPTDPDVAALVQRMDGLPLGLELAAAQLRTRRPAEITSDIGVRRRGIAARHTSLDSAVSWSWDLLGEDEQGALSALAELRGPWPLSAALALGVSVSHVDRLVERSLVQRYPQTSRWGLLETVRRFARPRQRDPNKTAERHIQWCVDKPDEPSLSDLEAALFCALDQRTPAVETLFFRLRERLFATGPLARFEQLVRALLGRVTAPALAVPLHVDLAMVMDTRGELREAIAVLRQASAMTAGVASLASSVDGNLANLYLRTGEYASARALASSAAEAARTSGDPRLLAMRLQFLAGLKMLAGELRSADLLLEEALTCAEPWPPISGGVLHLRARVCHLLGAPAWDLLDAAERKLASVPRHVANTQVLRIGMHQDRGEWDLARALLPDLDAQCSLFSEDVLLETARALVWARDHLHREDQTTARALLSPLWASAGVDRWLTSRVAPYLVSCLPQAEALAVAERVLGPARRDGLRLEIIQTLAGLCARMDAEPEAYASWRAEGSALCEEMGLPAQAWLRGPFVRAGQQLPARDGP